MRFYPSTSAGRIRHISQFPGIYCSLLDHLTSLVQTLRPQFKPGVADKSFIVCTSEKHVSRDFWSFMKQFHRIGHSYIF